jgi:outer membrane protein OmpA-like peptidoglycan-associated protein
MATPTDARKRLARAIVAITLMLGVAACSQGPKNLVVLLPEADGKVGEVSVTTAGGSTTLNAAGAATEVDSSAAAPGQVFQIEGDRVDTVFQPAISAQPTPPVAFTLYFRTGRTRMTRSSRARIKEILAEIERRDAPDIGIVGHTDRAGPTTYNEPLSRRRATIVRNLLVRAGIDSGIIEISWHGENNPIIETADGVNERRNRRVEVIVR